MNVQIDTDYLIVGAGAVGLAFADTLLAHSDADIVIVDRHGKPGGHWNDAYAFVKLHQPSAFYGVASLPLGSGLKDVSGVNAGLYELATGHEVSGYFDRVMQQRLIPSGRVRYLPMSDHLGAGRVRSLLSGQETTIRARRRLVDATYYGTTVPATHTPKFSVGEGVQVVPPNALPDLWRAGRSTPQRFVILGAGKTAMDVGVWLVQAGAKPEAITWVMPRDSWLLDRRGTQPGLDFFHETMGRQVGQLRAFGEGTSAEDVFLRMEAAGVVFRIDPTVMPTMFHYATMSMGEVEVLRAIKNVVRMGRVTALEPAQMVLERGMVPVDPNTLFIDCTATAVTRRPVVPIFQDGVITLQMVRIPQPAFSAALTAYVEVTGIDDVARNALCAPIPLPDSLDEFLTASLVNLMNQGAWSRNKSLNAWIRECRLDGFGKAIAALPPDATAEMALLSEFRTHAMAAGANLQRLIAKRQTPSQ